MKQHTDYCKEVQGMVSGKMEMSCNCPEADETAWLIEFKGPTYYGKGEEGLNVYADEKNALRFARKQDAEMVIEDIGWTAAKAVEHMWCEPRAPLT